MAPKQPVFLTGMFFVFFFFNLKLFFVFIDRIFIFMKIFLSCLFALDYCIGFVVVF